MAQFLVDNGADVTIRDPNHNATPRQWADYNQNEAVKVILESAERADSSE